MHTGRPIKKVFFDLNHPADFHLFKHLIGWMKEQGYMMKFVARDKECLHLLLDNAGISYVNRGKGKHSLVGKYLYAVWILILLFIELIRFRPNLCISLSSPYLVLLSRLLHINSVCYDDTDESPRELVLVKKSKYLLSPVTYPHKFHDLHFHLPAFKELAYLHPTHFKDVQEKQGIFVRLTRTDSVHHSKESVLDQESVLGKIRELNQNETVTLSSEMELITGHDNRIRLADTVHIHKDLQACRAFWGNSATMAAEAAVLGIPAIFVSAEKFAYIRELETFGLLFHFHPHDLDSSFAKLDSILAGEAPPAQFQEARKRLLREKMDLTAFLIWFVDNLPENALKMQQDPARIREFITAY